MLTVCIQTDALIGVDVIKRCKTRDVLMRDFLEKQDVGIQGTEPVEIEIRTLVFHVEVELRYTKIRLAGLLRQPMPLNRQGPQCGDACDQQQRFSVAAGPNAQQHQSDA